jgi:hypothetical protein
MASCVLPTELAGGAGKGLASRTKVTAGKHSIAASDAHPNA